MIRLERTRRRGEEEKRKILERGGNVREEGGQGEGS